MTDECKARGEAMEEAGKLNEEEEGATIDTHKELEVFKKILNEPDDLPTNEEWAEDAEKQFEKIAELETEVSRLKVDNVEIYKAWETLRDFNDSTDNQEDERIAELEKKLAESETERERWEDSQYKSEEGRILVLRKIKELETDLKLKDQILKETEIERNDLRKALAESNMLRAEMSKHLPKYIENFNGLKGMEDVERIVNENKYLKELLIKEWSE